MISVINMTVLTIVFIALLVERLDNFLLFLKDGNWYKSKKKKENILKRISKEPTRLTWDLLQPKVSAGTFPLWNPSRTRRPRRHNTKCRNTTCTGWAFRAQGSITVTIHYILIRTSWVSKICHKAQALWPLYQCSKWIQ